MNQTQGQHIFQLHPLELIAAVAVEGVMSSLSPVISGVPQDTVIAPVLFLLMISVIAREVSPSVLSFVDDTSVKRGIKDVATDWVSDLQTIYDWAEDVGLQFNCN